MCRTRLSDGGYSVVTATTHQRTSSYFGPRTHPGALPMSPPPPPQCSAAPCGEVQSSGTSQRGALQHGATCGVLRYGTLEVVLLNGVVLVIEAMMVVVVAVVVAVVADTSPRRLCLTPFCCNATPLHCLRYCSCHSTWTNHGLYPVHVVLGEGGGYAVLTTWAPGS